jgi:putative membrane protein
MVHMLLFWGMIILLIVALIRYLSNSSKSDFDNFQKSPMDILNERLARGEIDGDEFEERKRLLSN